MFPGLYDFSNLGIQAPFSLGWLNFMTMMKRFWGIANSLVTIFSLIGAYACMLASRRFKGLSRFASNAWIIVGSIYMAVFLVFFFSPGLRNKLHLPGFVKFMLQVVIFTALAYLTEVFAEHNADMLVSISLLLAALHSYTISHNFGIGEDFSISIGLMTVAVAVCIHMTEKTLYKILIMVSGSFLLSAYWVLKKRNAKRRALKEMENLRSEFALEIEVFERHSKELEVDITRMTLELERLRRAETVETEEKQAETEDRLTVEDFQSGETELDITPMVLGETVDTETTDLERESENTEMESENTVIWMLRVARSLVSGYSNLRLLRRDG